MPAIHRRGDLGGQPEYHPVPEREMEHAYEDDVRDFLIRFQRCVEGKLAEGKSEGRKSSLNDRKCRET